MGHCGLCPLLGGNLCSAFGLDFVLLDKKSRNVFYIKFYIIFLIFQHMIKYRYIPFTHGKARYKGKEDSGAVVSS